ncbi:hypothetical protein ARALYDRAFT_897923 [Arabidopsis lyrata subsp. lyrata]|uniref:FKB95-like N-terminal Kelch domain-containing protein n=1 Tax=Arabidopsis lyrata subsp. lyrata TaxID=81972 RepID=D7L5L6_ARALL|nr:hypothetical protein ARALYDRAFT_897923 [Arabidopsis lyrata subsp. lyrata]
MKKKKKKSSGYVLARVPIPDSPCVHFSGLVAVGSNIYNIGESINFSLSSSVSVLDCRSHTWREAPSLPVKLISLSASVFDRKIYVAGAAGRYNDVRSDNLKTSLEVFDTKTQTWDPEPIPCSEIKDSFNCRSIWIDGKFHVATHKDLFAYKSKEGRWDTVEPRQAMHHYLYSDSYCKIDNVLYSASDGAFRWYDTDISMWRNLVGLPKLLHLGYRVRLADYGGKLAVLWEEELPYYSGTSLRYEKMIWCAEISLERRKSWEIWGKVEWVDHMLTVPRTYELNNYGETTLLNDFDDNHDFLDNGIPKLCLDRQ